ncbi:UNVERIFIED_CONTAM: hypothetical protein Sindi_0417300 [Sesamum indicum]
MPFYMVFLMKISIMTTLEGYLFSRGKCVVEKVLYKLKHASRQWNQELTRKIVGYDSEFNIKDLGPNKYCLGLENAGSAGSCTPLPMGLKLTSNIPSPLIYLEPYKRLIHMTAAFHLVRYLRGCPEQGLFFLASNPLHVTAYCDLDWVSCVDSRQSLTGYCIFLGNALISWKTKKRTIVTSSTAEAEYRSLGTTVCELKLISYLL